jgi:hypothetical protein
MKKKEKEKKENLKLWKKNKKGWLKKLKVEKDKY